MRSVTVTAGEPETRCWCPVCLLPIRVRIPLHIDGARRVPAGVLEICPGCGTGHDQPSITVGPAPKGPMERWRPLAVAARAVHRLACRRTGRASRLCAHGDCRMPGLYRHEHTLDTDEGTWRYVFCSRRHRAAWARDHHILLPVAGGGAA